MALQKLELSLPEHVLRRLERRAKESHRSLQDELLILVTEAIPEDGEQLSEDLEQVLEGLAVLDDAALKRVASNPLASEVAEELEALNFKQQREGLSAAEHERHHLLMRQYEQVMLTRARAATLLSERGIPLSLPAEK